MLFIQRVHLKCCDCWEAGQLGFLLRKLRMTSWSSLPLSWVLKYSWSFMCPGNGMNKALRKEILRCWQLTHSWHRYICFLRRETTWAQRNDCLLWNHRCQSRLKCLGSERLRGWEWWTLALKLQQWSCLLWHPGSWPSCCALTSWKTTWCSKCHDKGVMFRNLLRSQGKVCTSSE